MTDPFEGVTLDRLRRRRGTKWSRHPPDVIPAWIADADCPPPPVVRTAIEDLLRRGDLTYPGDGEADAVADLFVDRQERLHGWRPARGGVRVVPETIQVISFVIDRCAPPGSPVAVHTPAYPPILAEVEALGRRLIPLPWERDGTGWTTDPAGPARAADGGCRLLVLVNPHNPTGRVWRRDELEALAAVVVERDLTVLSDEVHAELVHDGSHVPFASLGPEVAARTVTLTAPSKSFNIPGVKCSVAHLGSGPGPAAFAAVPGSQLGAVSNVGLAATGAVWTAGDEWLAGFRSAVATRRHQMRELLDRHLPGAGYALPEATYLAWLDCRSLGLGAEPVDWFLEHARVALGGGPDFGHGGGGHVRVNLATTPAILEEVVARMGAALGSRR